jgi:transcriptional regulator with XRE-family HTH domain
MPLCPGNHRNGLSGHALRNAHLCESALARAAAAPPLARAVVRIRAATLGMTRLELARRSGISRGALRDLELGLHKPTRHTLQQFVAFCRRRRVSAVDVEELRRLYAGAGDTLERLIARMELRAGSPRELARRVGISASTLWEYRRGHFPLPLSLLRRMCRAVGEDPVPAELLWEAAERRRLAARGYPEAWATLLVLCARAAHPESHLLALGVSTAALRKLRYLELPPWHAVAAAAQSLCRGKQELQALEKLWLDNERQQRGRPSDGFGALLKRLREQRSIPRRRLADLFGIGGKKPARIIKYIEEDGFYSAVAYPAGLAAVVSDDPAERERLVGLWEERRRQFHRRHRPETRVELRLAREQYGFEVRELAPLLGYAPLEYQRIERGVGRLLETGRLRILEAIHAAGRRRVEDLLKQRGVRDAERTAWRSPPSVLGMVTLLARREGGLAPLARHLARAGLRHISASRLRAIVRGTEVPPWQVLQEIARACDVSDLTDMQADWAACYRARLHGRCPSPLGVELRVLIAEAAPTLRAFSPRLGFNYSVLVRDLQRIDRDEPVKWFHVERILRAAGVPEVAERWREIHALWYTVRERRKREPTAPRARSGIRPPGANGVGRELPAAR